MSDNGKLLLVGMLLLLLIRPKKGTGNGSDNGVADCKGEKSFLDAKDVAALKNNNPGNLIRTSSKFVGEIASNGNFRRFACWKYGVRAMIKNLQGRYYFGKGERSVSDIIKVWAPLGGSLPNSITAQTNYINFVSSALGVPSTQKLQPTKNNLRMLVKSMAHFEAGKPIVSDEDFEKGWAIL